MASRFSGTDDADEADALYALPLADFTKERNALAARLAKAGDKARAAEVKSLPKPVISAWVVNQLARRAADDVDALLQAGDRARAAQAKALAGGGADALRERLEDLRAALLALRSRASAILEESGHAASDDVLERVTTTLRTASQAPEAADLVREGRLADDLDPLGIGVLGAGPRPVVAPAARRGRAEPSEEEAPRRETLKERMRRIAEESRGARPGKAAPPRRDDADRRRREREREEAERERAAQREREAKRAALQRAADAADEADAEAKRAVEEAESALADAKIALEKAKQEREDTLAAARRARRDLEKLAAPS